MEVRFLSVGARGFFPRRFATRLRGFAAQFYRPQREKKPLAPRELLATLTRDNHQCVHSLRMRKTVIICTMYPNAELWKLYLLFLRNRNSATPETENH